MSGSAPEAGPTPRARERAAEASKRYTLSENALTSAEHPQQPRDRIVEAIDDALLEGNDRVVGDRNVLGADLRAALRDVAVADALRFLQLGDPILGVERVHLECRGVDDEARADELIVLVVIAQDVTDVLAQIALDALAEFLDAIDVRLLHPPRTVRRVGRARLERLDALLHLEVPRHVGDEILDVRERPH